MPQEREGSAGMRRQVTPRARFLVTMTLSFATSVLAALATLNVATFYQERHSLARDSVTMGCVPTSVDSSDRCIARLKSRYRDPGPPAFPAGNPFSQAKHELGQRLFSETQLSGSGGMSCMSCHQPDKAWGDGRPRAIGDAGKAMDFRTPTLLNVGWMAQLGWDGKFPDLESVAFVAIAGHRAMNLDPKVALARIRSMPAYAPAFRDAFGSADVTERRVADALATFERSIVSKPAPFDAWISGDDDAIPEAAKRGFVIFNGAGRCASCHTDWMFSDGSFHDVGTADEANPPRATGEHVRRRPNAFKVPTLRDVAARAPYMHDGSLATLADVVDLYDRGGRPDKPPSPELKPLGLTATQRSQLVAFMATLSPDREERQAAATQTRCRTTPCAVASGP